MYLLHSLLTCPLVVFLVMVNGDQSIGKQSNTVCSNLNLMLTTLGCTWTSPADKCQNRTIEFYNGNKNVSQKITGNETIKVENPDFLYNQKSISFSCKCVDQGKTIKIKNGTIYSKDLPLPVHNAISVVRYLGNYGYTLDIKFSPVNRAHTYEVKGTIDMFDADDSKIDCKRTSNSVLCPDLFKEDIVAGLDVKYQIWSIGNLGTCVTKFKRVISYNDTYGPPRKLYVKEISKDYVVFSFASRLNMGFNVDYYLDVCQGICKDSEGKYIELNTTYKKSDLSPLIKYSARLRYRKGSYISEWTQPVYFKTKSAEPNSRPESVKCRGIDEKYTYLLTWKPALQSPDVNISTYVIKIKEAVDKQHSIVYNVTSLPTYQQKFRIDSNVVDVLVIPCSESGCGDSFSEGVTCKFVPSSKPDSSALETAVGISVAVVLLVIAGAVFFLWRYHHKMHVPREDREVHSQLEGTYSIGPHVPYEEEPQRGPRQYVPIGKLGDVGQESSESLVADVNRQDTTESSCGSSQSFK